MQQEDQIREDISPSETGLNTGGQELREWKGDAAALPETVQAGLFPAQTPQGGRKKRSHLFLLLSVSLLVVVSAALMAQLLFQPTSTITLQQPFSTLPMASVGKLLFLSSGQLNPKSSTGLNDMLSLDLAGLASPHQGTGYYAWLLADKTQDATPPILLGRLSAVGGRSKLTYQEPQHRDLLVTYSRVLITEQADNVPVNLPSLDTKTWRYQATIADTPTPGDEKGYSLLSHLRHLLAQDPTLQELGLQGGLEIWLYRNSGKIFEWSSAARDDWTSQDVRDLHNNITRILDYLDGASYAFRDLPAGTLWLVDQQAGRPGLIDYTNPQEELGPPSYISHIRLHLTGMVNAPGHTVEQQQLASTIDTALTQIDTVMKAIRSDARKLALLNDRQFKAQSTLTVLNDMVVLANNAYTGTTDPTTGATQFGIVWVHSQLQSLATVPVTVATADGP